MRTKIKDNPIKGLSFLYNNFFGRIVLKLLVGTPTVSKLAGLFLDSKISKILIKSFVRNNNINLDDFEKTKYNNFNEFFIRKIKKEKRPICMDENTFIAPCDSKLTCYKIDKNTTFNIKNTIYDINSLIKNEEYSKKYAGGYVLVFRLSPDDYHRYCFIDEGKIINNYKIKGKLHTVNPIVYDKFAVFKENSRECTILDTKNFEKVMYVEVGALLVGKLKNGINSGNVTRGMEKGYFMYGGSTVVLIIQENILKLDDDIMKNSEEGYETYVKYGENIGKKI